MRIPRQKPVAACESNCPIEPRHLDVKHGIWNAFGKSEAEGSAVWIVEFCQERGSWNGFTKAALDKFAGEDFWFNGLTTTQSNQTKKWTWLIEKNDKLFPSVEFVAVCYTSAPAIETT